MIEAHIATCSECQEVLRTLTQNISEYRANLDTHRARLRLRLEAEAARERRRRRQGGIALAAGLALAASLALVLAPSQGPFSWMSPPEIPALGSSPSPQYKGLLGVNVVADQGGDQITVSGGERLTEGDRLRFVVTTGSAGYLSVFSLDGRNAVTSLYPQDAAEAPVPLDSEGRHELEGSVILDDATGTEHFVVVFSPETFDRETIEGTIVTQLRNGARQLDPVDGCTIEVLSVEKVSIGPTMNGGG